MAAARQAGVPSTHLEAMAGALKVGPGKLDDFPKSAAAAPPLFLTEDEEEEEVADPEPNTGDPVTDALVTLTQIVKNMNKKPDSKASLEDALDQVGSNAASGSGDVSTSMGRKHAAARRALHKAFMEDPAQIWRSIESNMSQDFNLQTAMPNATSAFSARGWCEHRSKIQPYIRTCRWVWGIAGILDDLRLNLVDRARARAGLLLAAAEQESLDHGSFLLSQEFLMEPAVPVSSFQNHHLPEPVEMATTRLLDPRWIEAFADRLKQLDAYVEMRKKLNIKSRGSLATNQDLGGKGKWAKGKWKKGAVGETDASET